MRRAVRAYFGLVLLGGLLPAPAPSLASTPNACRLLSATEIAGPTRQHHVIPRTILQTGFGATGLETIFSLCDYYAGVHYSIADLEVAELQLLEMPNASDASREFSRDFVLASGNGNPSKVVSGPWSRGYQFGSEEIWALKSVWVFHFYFVENSKKSLHIKEGLVRGIAAKAVSRLP